MTGRNAQSTRTQDDVDGGRASRKRRARAVASGLLAAGAVAGLSAGVLTSPAMALAPPPTLQSFSTAALNQQLVTNQLQAQTLYTQAAADAQRQRLDRFRLIQESQTRILQITQAGLTTTPQPSAPSAYNALAAYLR
jgi:hypothetical protein